MVTNIITGIKKHTVRSVAIIGLLFMLVIMSWWHRQPHHLLKFPTDVLSAFSVKLVNIDKKIMRLTQSHPGNPSNTKEHNPKKALEPSLNISRHNLVCRRHHICQKISVNHVDSDHLNKSHLAKYFTLQLMGTKNKSALEKFVKKHHMHATTIITMDYKNHPWFILTLGKFKQSSTAKKYLQHLSWELRRLHPWVRPITMQKSQNQQTHRRHQTFQPV